MSFAPSTPALSALLVAGTASYARLRFASNAALPASLVARARGFAGGRRA